MANEVFELFTELKPVIFATVIDKSKLKERYGFNVITPKQCGIIETISRFSSFLKSQTNSVGIIMMDQEKVKTDRLGDFRKPIFFQKTSAENRVTLLLGFLKWGFRRLSLIQEMILGLRIFGMERGYSYPALSVVEGLDRILNTIGFSDSSIIPGIQLADVCCRTVWQNYERGKDERYKQLESHFNNTGAVEPVVIPKWRVFQKGLCTKI
ncbi:MAG: DUF3800 domain-containing protein [Nitrososphaerota archaeon]|jgi:hypothetical protein|nr:DUF3800 domain-containing protein [Nitrososphaerota archaeon]